MNKKKFAVLILLFVAVVGFSLGAASAANSYTKYKGSFKLYHDSSTYMGNKYPYPFKKSGKVVIKVNMVVVLRFIFIKKVKK